MQKLFGFARSRSGVLFVVLVGVVAIGLTSLVTERLMSRKVRRTIATTPFVAGIKAQAANDYTEAIAQFQAAVDKKADDIAALQGLATAQYQANRYDDAIKTYQKLGTFKGYGAFAANAVGNIERDQKKPEQAEASYRQAISQDSHFVVAYSNLAILLVDQKKSDDAMKVLADALKENPQSSELRATQTALNLK